MAARLARQAATRLQQGVILPEDLRRADAQLAALHLRLAASRHLNPTDEVEARARFLRGGPARFRYLPLTDADDLLRGCETIRPPLDHPLGVEVAAARDELFCSIVALRDRTAAAFDALAVASGWYDEAGPAPTRATPVRPHDESLVDHDALLAAFRDGLAAAGHPDWTVQTDPIMSARVVVDSPRRTLRVNPRAVASQTEVLALVAHEIGVHVGRAAAGARQPLTIFANGLARSLATEEGLALHAEARAVGLPVGASDRLALLAAAGRRAREQGFTGLYRGLEPLLGASGAWTTCVRLKRGLASPEEPGVYAKDRVYWVGWCRVSAWLEAGGDERLLSVGKVSIDHPVAAWIVAGWINPPG